MQVFTNTTCTGYYPVGFAAVVVANNAEEAAHLLSVKLAGMYLPQEVRAVDMEPLDLTEKAANVLVNGDY